MNEESENTIRNSENELEQQQYNNDKDRDWNAPGMAGGAA